MYIYILCSLFDISLTGVLAYNSQKNNLIERNQQRNWQVVYQLLQMRSQLVTVTEPVVNTIDLNKLDFGSEFSGQHRVWIVIWAVERPDLYGSHNQLISLKNDFDKVPMIADLSETVTFQNNCFETTGKMANICFYTKENWNKNILNIDFASIENQYNNK